jgi:CspA family cold shock protein
MSASRASRGLLSRLDLIQFWVCGGESRASCFRAKLQDIFFEEVKQMAEGTIKRLTDKGFGFIDTGTDQDMFFHSSSLQGVSYEELQEGQRVSYTEGQGPKGPRAENVTLV